jgi:hypothetical protein
MSQLLHRLNHRNPPNIRMKSIFSSMTIWGFLIALVSRFVGHEIAVGQATDLVAQATEAWPLLVGVGADLVVAWRRVTATKFDVGRFASPAFWAALVGGVMAALQAVEVDWSGLEDLPDKVGIALASIGGFVGLVFQIAGPARATQPLGLVSDPAPSMSLTSAVVIPSWVGVVLRLIPWRVLFAFVLQKWLGITPAQFEEIIKTVGYVDGKPLKGVEKAMFVHDNLSRAYPHLRSHEREAAVALAVAGLVSEGKIQLS